MRICNILSRYYPISNLANLKNPLWEAIFILLSSQTDEFKYLQTWHHFRHRFPSFRQLSSATKRDIYSAIKHGGLGKWKTERIYNLIRQVQQKYSKLSLAFLKTKDDRALENELMSLDGLGIKSARCIMMYSFGRDVFPVDTHVLRIVKRLGFKMPPYTARSLKFADAIQNQVPAKFRYRLHVNIVQHGRGMCKAKPNCFICPLSRVCITGQYKIKNAISK